MIYIDLDELIKNRNKQGKKTNMLKLAKDTGISRNNLYNLKRGNAKGIEFPTLNKLMRYFNVPINKILKFSKDDVSIDIYNYKEFFSEKEFNNLWNAKVKSMVKSKQSKNDDNDKLFHKYYAIVGYDDMSPLMYALYVRFTYKDNQYWCVLKPFLNSNKNTINPKITPNLIPPWDFDTWNNLDYDEMGKYMETWNYVRNTFIKKMTYNQKLFLLCRMIQFSQTLSDRNYDKLNDLKKQYQEQSKILDILFRPKHYTDKQQFILQVDNSKTAKQYRLTKKQILNYKQPSQTDFNTNFYNFIIRDHTKE